MVIAGQCLHRVEAFAAPHPIPAVRKPGQVRKVGGDPAGTADPNCSKGYPRPQLSIQSWGKLLGAAAWELARHQPVGAEQLNCASLVLYSLIILSSSLIIIIIIIISLSCPIKLSLSQPTDFTFFLYHLTVRVSGCMCSAELPARLNPRNKSQIEPFDA